MAIIGREAPADIIVPMPQVSARHAEIRHIGAERFSIVDLGSTNGTFVNGDRIQSTTVTFGDRIRLGQLEISLYSFRAQLLGASEGAAPVKPADVLSHTVDTRRAEVSLPSAPPAPTRPHDSALRAPGMGTEVAVALAANRSLVGPALLTWVCYYLFWLPGVIANLVYLGEAGRIKKMTGQSPGGTGCLWFLAITHLALPLALIAVTVITGGALLVKLRSLVP